MIVSEIFYGLRCDRCKANYEGYEFSFFSSEASLIEDADSQDWLEHNGKHYCTDCAYIDDNDDIIIKDNLPKWVESVKTLINQLITSEYVAVEEHGQNMTYTFFTTDSSNISELPTYFTDVIKLVTKGKVSVVSSSVTDIRRKFVLTCYF